MGNTMEILGKKDKISPKKLEQEGKKKIRGQNIMRIGLMRIVQNSEHSNNRDSRKRTW